MPRVIHTTAIMMAFLIVINDAPEGSSRTSDNTTLLASLKVRAK